MTSDQATALIIAITGLVGALTAMFVQLRQVHKTLNGRLTELVQAAGEKEHKIGELEGRDFIRRLQNPPPGQGGAVSEQTAGPTDR